MRGALYKTQFTSSKSAQIALAPRTQTEAREMSYFDVVAAVIGGIVLGLMLIYG
jgi:hypothetical protein